MCVCVGVYIEMYDMVTNAVNLKLFIVNNFFILFTIDSMSAVYTDLLYREYLLPSEPGLYIFFSTRVIKKTTSGSDVNGTRYRCCTLGRCLLLWILLRL